MQTTPPDFAQQAATPRHYCIGILQLGSAYLLAPLALICMPITWQCPVMQHALVATMRSIPPENAFQVWSLIDVVCPSTPAYFGDQVTKRCLLACPENTFSFFNNTHRICVTYCPPRTFIGVTNTVVNLYADNSTWQCVTVCPSTPNYFAFAHPSDTTIRTCVSTCPLVSVGGTPTYYFADVMTRSCTTVCPWSNMTTYGDPLTFLCTKNCSRTQFRLNTTYRCVWTCPTPYFADNTTWYCVQKCPNGTFAMAAGTNRTCVLNCPTGTYA